jgi:hypothetical protein
MKFAASPAPSFCSSNAFRGEWKYQRLPAGDAMLAAGKGLSPGFFNLLQAIDNGQAISFTALARRFPHLEPDDLELWLAELCGMQLIAPPLPSSVPIVLAAKALALAGSAAPAIRVLLVHESPATRLAWRNLLGCLPLELIEVDNLEEATAAYYQLQPAAVLLGPGNGDAADTLNFLHVLRQPRSPGLVKVLLVLAAGEAGPRINAAAARVDDTVFAAAWDGLAGRLAHQLDLPWPPAVIASPPAPRLLCDLAPAPPRPGLTAGAADPAQTGAAAAGHFKHKSMDALYNDLMAICAELEMRERPKQELLDEKLMAAKGV